MILTGSLLTLLRRCSLVRLFQKLWAWLSPSVWGFSRSIPLRRLLLCSLCFLSLLLFSLRFVNDVGAQTPTETETPQPTSSVVHNLTLQPPTATWSPLFPSATPRPLQDGACPADGSQPVGVGTGTPDPNWLMDCGHCITPTAAVWPTYDMWTDVPVPTLDGTLYPTEYAQTATAAVTPSPTVQITATVQPHFYPGDPFIRQHRKERTGTSGYYQTTVDWSDQGYPMSCGTDEIVGYAWRPVSMMYDGGRTSSGITINPLAWRTSVSALTYNIGTQTWSYPSNVGFYNYAGVLVDTLVSTYLPAYSPRHWATWSQNNVETKGGIPGRIYIYGANTDSFNLTFEVQPLCYGAGLQTPTPTPTATGTPSAYCSAVQTVPSVPELELPVPRVGPAECLQIGGFTLGFGWVANLLELAGFSPPEAIEVPGVRYCFAPITFGTLDLLGIKMDMDAISAVMSAIAALYLVLRSS